jgi:hypothetical protein
MKVKLSVRYLSGREEHFELGLEGGKLAELRLKEFVKDPTVLLKTADQVIIIPSHAIECLTLTLPPLDREPTPLAGVRNAKRLPK